MKKVADSTSKAKFIILDQGRRFFFIYYSNLSFKDLNANFCLSRLNLCLTDIYVVFFTIALVETN